MWPLHSSPSAEAFFSAYLTVPVVIVFYVGHKLWTKNWQVYIRAKDIDIDTGRRNWTWTWSNKKLPKKRLTLLLCHSTEESTMLGVDEKNCIAFYTFFFFLSTLILLQTFIPFVLNYYNYQSFNTEICRLQYTLC